MTVALAPLNPFISQTVSSLRKIEPPLRWLNDAALRKLMAVFEVVEEKPHRCELVQLVLSRGDGYGKSHLLGRLIHDLNGRATSVSVATFDNPLNCWMTLLQSMLDELSQPEFTHQLPLPPTQLDELAHQVFGFLTVMLADKGEVDAPLSDEHRDDILQGAFEKWDLSNPESSLGIWVHEALNSCEQNPAREAILVRLLKAATLHTYSDDATAMNWLLVLHRYASDRADEDSRQMCLQWMISNEMESAAELSVQNEQQLAQNNLIARQQVLDLLALAKLFRPFVLCFDQTRSLPLITGLAKAFGNMLMELVRSEGAHFSIVTANSGVWESEVLPGFDPACIHCLATKMELVGMSREQGRSLAEQRLQGNGDSGAFQERFLDKEWLQQQFAQGSLGQRDFLTRCELRYQAMVPNATRPPEEYEVPEEEALPDEPLMPDLVSEVPVPDFNAAHELAPDTEINISELEQETTEQMTEVPGSLPAWHEVSAVTPIAATEYSAPMEIVEAPCESSVIAADTLAQAMEAEDAISETPDVIEQEYDQDISTAANHLTEPELLQLASVTPEAPAPPELLPDSFPALTPPVEIIENTIVESCDFNPSVEEFLSEQAASANHGDSEEVTTAPDGPDGDLNQLCNPEANAIASDEISSDVTEPIQDGQEEIQIVPSIEITADQIDPAAIITEETSTDSFPQETAVLETTIEPQITEGEADTSSAIDFTTPSEVSAITEFDSPIDEATAQTSDEGPEISQVAAVVDRAPAVDPALLKEVMLQIISAHRFASYIAISDELRRKMQRSVPVEEAILCAQSTSEIHVYADGPNAAFLWQGAN